MRIAGNLDVEVTWARMDAAARRARGEKAPRPDDPRFALPEAVMRKISAAATLMRVFAASDDDELWTPRPVDPSRMAPVEWLPAPRLVSGPVPETADVWWGRRDAESAGFGHRASALHWRQSIELPLDGAAVVRTIDELESRAASFATWVAKAPYSAAGRLVVRSPLDDRSRSQAQSLLDLYGCLLFEPWLARTADFGASVDPYSGAASDAAWTMNSPHTLDVDALGRFRGISTRRESEVPNSPDGEIHDEVTIAALSATTAATELGLRPPFGVDLYRAADPAGGTRLQLSEVNARRTFGHVANQLAERWTSHMGERTVVSVTLRFGRGNPPDGTIPLLLPGTDDDTAAWLEVPDRHGS